MRGSIRERRPKVWNLCVELPPGPGGQRRQKNFTVYGAKRDAQRRLREILTELDKGRFTQPGKVTLEEHLEQWVQRTKVADTSRERYRNLIRQTVPVLGDVPLPKLTQEQIEEFLAGLPHSPRTVSLFHRLLVTALNDAVKRNLIRVNPAKGAEHPEIPHKRSRFLERDEVALILRSIEGRRLHPMVLVGATTGLRAGEVAGLKWADLVLPRSGPGRLSVHRTVQRLSGQGPVAANAPKTKHSRRTITLPTVTVRALRIHRWKQYRLYRWMPQEFVFCAARGGVINPSWISQRFSEVCKALGIDASFHALRHTHASQLIEDNVPLKVISERLGHSSITVTADTYGHLLRGLDERVANLIDSHFV